MSDDASDLKPCPFCGSDPVIKHGQFKMGVDYKFQVVITCSDKYCHAKPCVAISGDIDHVKSNYIAKSDAERVAKEHWNKRQDSDN